MSGLTDMGGFARRGGPVIVNPRSGFPFYGGGPGLNAGRQGNSLILDLNAKFGFIPGIALTDLRYGSGDRDDFTQGSVASTFNAGAKSIVTVSGSATGVSVQPDTSNVNAPPYSQGVLRVSAGVTAGGRAAIFGACVDGTHGALCLGRGWMAFSHLFSTLTLSGVNDTYSLLFGIADTGATSSINNIINAVYTHGTNGGAWQLAVSAGGVVQTSANGSTPVVGSTSYNATIVIDNRLTTAYLFVSVNGGPFKLECTYTGTLPASNVMMGTYAAVRLTTGSNGTDQFEYDGWQWDFRSNGLR